MDLTASASGQMARRASERGGRYVSSKDEKTFHFAEMHPPEEESQAQFSTEE